MNNSKKQSSRAIGIIGGDSGSTFILTSDHHKSQDDLKQKEFLDFAATQVAANFRPFAEIEELLLVKYKATPYTLRENELRILKASVTAHRFGEVLGLPTSLPPKPTRKQLIEYAENNTTFEQARNYPAEELGLIFKAYKFPSEMGKDGTVKLEMTTEYMVISNTTEEVARELFLWQGISQDDIDNKTPRFVAYVYALHDLGKLGYAK